MQIKRLENYHTGENTYLVYDEHDKTGFVVDPGYRVEGILKAAQDDEIEIKFILITHCHYDHIDALEPVREKTGAKLIASEKGSRNIGDPVINLTHAFGRTEICAKPAEIIAADGQKIQIGKMEVTCITTPGHSNCGICYICEGHIFTGDTLFLREVGRWDLPTGNEEELKASIKNKLYCLEDCFIIHPGHGDDSTIGYEKKFNFYVNIKN